MTMEPKNQHLQTILAPVRRVSAGDYLLWGTLLALMLTGLGAWTWQYMEGLGITGMNRPVYWGVYITNFVFFIGLAHSGTFISAILRIAGQSWRAPLTCAAEAITLFSLPFGAGSIIIDMGRPERLLNLIFYGRYQSPILWDVTAVSLYMLSSIVFFYLSLIPDIAMCRDRLTDAPRWQRRMYEILALGWNHSPEQYHRLEKVLDGMAVFMTMLVVTVHTVVSWLFGMTVQPGWHTALIGPFFLLGAILSGTAAVVIVLALLRKVYGLENVLHIGLFNSLRNLLITFVLGWLYMMIAEHLTIGYSNMTEEMTTEEQQAAQATLDTAQRAADAADRAQARAQAAIAAAWENADAAAQITVTLYRDLALRDVIRKTGNASLADSITSNYYKTQALTALGDSESARQLAADLGDAYPLVELAARVRGDSLAPAQASLNLANALRAAGVNAEAVFRQAHEAAQRIAIKPLLQKP